MKNVRRFLIILSLLLAISGLVSGVFASSLERALVLPTNHTVREPSVTTPAAVPPIQVPTPTTMAPLPTTTSTHILAQDTFERPDQARWGAASDGQKWEGDANTQAQSFFVAGKVGVITHAQGTLNAVLGPVSSNVEVLASGSVSHFGDTINFGVVVRWIDSKNWYKALINGTQFVVLKRVNGVTTQLGAQSFTAQGNTLYTIHLRAIGAVLLAKVWPSADPEPPVWMLNLTDTSLPTGRGGVRVLVQNDAVVHLAAFFESSTRSQV
jgi:hypothetical protein